MPYEAGTEINYLTKFRDTTFGIDFFKIKRKNRPEWYPEMNKPNGWNNSFKISYTFRKFDRPYTLKNHRIVRDDLIFDSKIDSGMLGIGGRYTHSFNGDRTLATIGIDYRVGEGNISLGHTSLADITEVERRIDASYGTYDIGLLHRFNSHIDLTIRYTLENFKVYSLKEVGDEFDEEVYLEEKFSFFDFGIAGRF